jgi:hypothetical protein
MHADDRPSASMTFFLHAVLHGSIDRSLMSQAVAVAQKRHVLTRAVIGGSRKAKTRNLSWQPAANPLAPISFATAGDPLPGPIDLDAHIDIRREVGVRLFFRQHADRTELFLQFHHAVADAIAATRFLEDVLAAYGAQASGGEPPFRHLNAALLAQRSKSSRIEIADVARLVRDAARVFRLMRREAEPVVGRSNATIIAPSNYPSFVSTALSSEDLRHLRQHGLAAGATVNDVLLRNLFLALKTFRQADETRRPIRVAMPVNLRGAALAAAPVAPIVGMAFIDRPVGAINPQTEFLAGIVRETRRIKDEHGAAALLRAVNLAGRRPLLLRTMCKPTYCFATAVLSNVVSPFEGSPLAGPDGKLRAGPITLESCALLPPIRPLTHAAIGVLTYSGVTQIALNFDARSVDTADASRLLELFCGREIASKGVADVRAA